MGIVTVVHQEVCIAASTINVHVKRTVKLYMASTRQRTRSSNRGTINVISTYDVPWRDVPAVYVITSYIVTKERTSERLVAVAGPSNFQGITISVQL
jgi:hypothetical protein